MLGTNAEIETTALERLPKAITAAVTARCSDTQSLEKATYPTGAVGIRRGEGSGARGFMESGSHGEARKVFFKEQLTLSKCFSTESVKASSSLKIYEKSRSFEGICSLRFERCCRGHYKSNGFSGALGDRYQHVTWIQCVVAAPETARVDLATIVTIVSACS